jgi:hypothetical protein
LIHDPKLMPGGVVASVMRVSGQPWHCFTPVQPQGRSPCRRQSSAMSRGLLHDVPCTHLLRHLLEILFPTPSIGGAPVDARFQARFATMQQRLGSPGEGGAGPAADGTAARVAQVQSSADHRSSSLHCMVCTGAHFRGCSQHAEPPGVRGLTGPPCAAVQQAQALQQEMRGVAQQVRLHAVSAPRTYN